MLANDLSQILSCRIRELNYSDKNIEIDKIYLVPF